MLWHNWMDFSLSFEAASQRLTWSIGDEAFGTRTLQAVERDAFNALRIDARTSNPGHQLPWRRLAFSGPATLGSLLASGSVSNQTRTQWLIGLGSDALSLRDWRLSGQVLATGGSIEATRWSINTANVTPVPEPGSWALWAAGLAAMGAVVRRRQG